MNPAGFGEAMREEKSDWGGDLKTPELPRKGTKKQIGFPVSFPGFLLSSESNSRAPGA
jgi:hypothetical protein